MKWLSIPLSILFLLFFACEEDSLQELNDSLIPQQDSRLIVRLTDNPGDFEEVNVNIQEFRVETVEEGWINLPNVNTGIYDLLALQNGVEAVLVDDGFPSGRITQIRLILGDENTVKVDGKVFPLKTPGAQQSGLKLKVNAELESGSSLSILLDFDACKSVHQAGDKYILKPVIKAILPDGTEFDSD